MKNKGFTIIELLLVISLIGILAVFALPTFYNWTSSANTAAVNGVVAAVKAGISLSKANSALSGTTSLPGSLETEASASVPYACTAASGTGDTTGCFDIVLDPSAVVKDGHFCRFTANVYKYFAAAQTGTNCPTSGQVATITYTASSGDVSVTFP